MLIAITVNHLDTELRVLTDHVFGFVSTAEGFVFLSGLVAGLVYTRRAARQSEGELRQHAWQRAREIYTFHLCSFAIVFAGLLLLTSFTEVVSATSPALFFDEPATALFLGSLLLYQPGLLDILPMYCGFMIVLPTVLAGLRTRRWGWLAATSLGLWLLAQVGLRESIQEWLAVFGPVNLGAFDVLAWQILFIGGVFLGHYWAVSPRPILSFRPAMLGLCLAVAVPLWMLKNEYFSTGILPTGLLWAWADKSRLAPLRLLNFVVIAYLIAAVGAYRPRLFIIRPLVFLGQHSLPVFACEASICLFLLTQPQLATTFAGRTMTALGMVVVLFVIAWVHDLLTTRQRVVQPAVLSVPVT